MSRPRSKRQDWVKCDVDDCSKTARHFYWFRRQTDPHAAYNARCDNHTGHYGKTTPYTHSMSSSEYIVATVMVT